MWPRCPAAASTDLKRRRRVQRAGRATLTIWTEMALAMTMVPVLALVHGWGLTGMSHLFNLTDEALLHKKYSAKSIFLVAFVAVLLFAVHAFEIAAVGLLYDLADVAPSFEQAFILSASYYTTTGTDHLPDHWAIFGQSEALLGLLLIGWSTAFLVRKIDRLEKSDRNAPDQMRDRRLRNRTGFGGHERDTVRIKRARG